MNHDWIICRRWFRYVVAVCIYEDFLGAGYKWARNDKGRVLRYWRKEDAQAMADKLNRAAADEQNENPEE